MSWGPRRSGATAATSPSTACGGSICRPGRRLGRCPAPPATRRGTSSTRSRSTAALPSAIDEYTFLFVPLSGWGHLFGLAVPHVPAQEGPAAARGTARLGSPSCLQTASSATPGPSWACPTPTDKSLGPAPDHPVPSRARSRCPRASSSTCTDTWGKPYLRAATSGTALRQWDWGFFTTHRRGNGEALLALPAQEDGSRTPRPRPTTATRLVTNYRTKVRPATVAGGDAVNEHQGLFCWSLLQGDARGLGLRLHTGDLARNAGDHRAQALVPRAWTRGQGALLQGARHRPGPRRPGRRAARAPVGFGAVCFKDRTT